MDTPWDGSRNPDDGAEIYQNHLLTATDIHTYPHNPTQEPMVLSCSLFMSIWGPIGFAKARPSH